MAIGAPANSGLQRNLSFRENGRQRISQYVTEAVGKVASGQFYGISGEGGSVVHEPGAAEHDGGGGLAAEAGEGEAVGDAGDVDHAAAKADILHAHVHNISMTP